MSAELIKPPSRQELEALSLPERIALEDVLGEAHEFVRELNDAEIARLHEAGASQRDIATACGRQRDWVRYRLAKLGLAAHSGVGEFPQALPQNGDMAEGYEETVEDERRLAEADMAAGFETLPEEVVDAEVVLEDDEAEPPASRSLHEVYARFVVIANDLYHRLVNEKQKLDTWATPNELALLHDLLRQLEIEFRTREV